MIDKGIITFVAKIKPNLPDMKDFLKRLLSLRVLIGLLIGGAAGYAYYHFVGCHSGACPIWTSPFRSTAIGMVFGILIAFK